MPASANLHFAVAAPATPRADRPAWRRVDPRIVVALAGVMLVHAAWLLWVSVPLGSAVRRRALSPVSSHDALRVRLIPARALPAPPIPRASPVPAIHAPATRPEAHVAPVSPLASSGAADKPTRVIVSVLPGHAFGHHDKKQWTIGRTLAAPRRNAPRLPGGGHVAGAPVFHMVDPRMQGIAGAVRIVQSMLGVPNPHCIDVNTWRSMSPQALAKRHISSRAVERTARRNGCIPPVRGDLSHDPFKR